MAFSQIEQRYMDMIAEAYFPTMQPEPEPMAAEPSLDGVQLAAGPSDTRTDAPAGVRVGRGGVRYQPPSMRDIAEPAGAMLDMGAATAKGMTQGFLGFPGDLEAIAYGVKEIFNRGADEGVLAAFFRGMEENTILPKTEEVKAWLDKNVGDVSGSKNPYEYVGEAVAPGGYVKVLKPAKKAKKAAAGAAAAAPASVDGEEKK